MSYTVLFEMFLVIFFLIQSNNSVNFDIFKEFNIFIRMLAISMLCISVFNWAHEGSELSWDDPVKITVFNSLIVFVFFNVERFEIIPTKSNGIFETLKAMEKSAIVEAVAL